MSEKHWTKIYEKEHESSFRNYEPLDLSNNPIVLRPGQTRGVYIHSSIEDDTGIVYDNQQKIKTHDDKFITVLPGRAHVSTKPFGTMPIWGHGNPWRGKICFFFSLFTTISFNIMIVFFIFSVFTTRLFDPTKLIL
jgi:hypothetical protein